MYRHAPRSRFFLPFAGVAASLLLAGLVSGCEVEGKADAGRLSVPSQGKARIVATKISDTPEKVHWKWSLIGERNWGGTEVVGKDKAGAGNLVLGLTEPSPINNPTKAKGCNVWELDLTAEKADGAVQWKATLHGSDGTTTETASTEPSTAAKAGDVVRVLQTGDATPGLPAELKVAEINGKPLVFRVAK
jgi:hypothetical protein